MRAYWSADLEEKIELLKEPCRESRTKREGKAFNWDQLFHCSHE